MHHSLFVASCATCLIAGQALAGTTIDLFPSLGPPSVASNHIYEPGMDPSPSLVPFGENAVGAILDNQKRRGGSVRSTPTAFNTRKTDQIRFTDFLATEFPSWRSDFNPTGAFANEKGTAWRVGIRIESSTAFTLSHFTIHEANPFEVTTDTLAELMATQYPEAGFNKALAVGIWYGPDGVRGTADDVVCDSLACDPETQPLNLLAWRGRGHTDTITLQELSDYFGGDKAALKEDERRFYGGLPPYVGAYDYPFQFKSSYSVTDADGNLLASRDYVGTVSGAPEPETWLMMIVGAGFTGIAMRRRRIVAA